MSAVDADRMLPLGEVEGWLRDAGFLVAERRRVLRSKKLNLADEERNLLVEFRGRYSGSRHRTGARFTLSRKALKNRNEFDVFRPGPKKPRSFGTMHAFVRSMGYGPEKQKGFKWDSRCSCFVTLRLNLAPILCRDPDLANLRFKEQRCSPSVRASRCSPLSTKDSNRGFDGDAANAGSPEFSPDCGAKDLRQLQRRRHP